jgi:hypothetical protein
MANFILGPLQHAFESESVEVPADVSFDGPKCDSVRKLFKKHNLDPKNLRHWHVLIWEIAEELKKHTPGRRWEWTSSELFTLRWRVEWMQKKEPQKTDGECCEALAKRHYKDLKSGTLRRRLADARNPDLEAEYKSFLKWFDRAFREHRERKVPALAV